MESLVDKSDVCVIPQTDMKFSVVNLNDFTGSIESIHSVSSQSKVNKLNFIDDTDLE